MDLTLDQPELTFSPDFRGGIRALMTMEKETAGDNAEFLFLRYETEITGAGAAGIVLGVFLIFWDVLPKITSGAVSFPLLAGATIVVLAVAGMVYIIGKK